MPETRGPVFVLALVGALLAGAGLAAWLHAARDRAATGDAAESGHAPGAAAPLEPAAEERAANSAESSRERAAAARGGEPSVAARPAPAHPGSLSGRVVDERGRPLAGARVSLSRAEARELDVLDLALEASAERVGEALSGGDGSFRFELERGVPVDVHAELAGRADALHADAYAGQELELVLAAGARVTGRVTRARDGTPVEGARVRAFRLGGPASVQREARTRADGSYSLALPFRDDAALEVVPEGLQCSPWIELEIGPDDRCVRDVALADGVTVAGTVRAADTGLPIAGATVGEGWWFRRTATTDARGEYRLAGFGDPGVRELGARASGYGSARAEAPAAGADGVVRLDFALRPARTVRGRVVDAAGEPVEGAYVAAVASEIEDGGQRTDWLSARTGPDGRYAIGDLARDLGHALLVSKRGYGTALYDLPESELETDDLVLPDVVLRAPALLAGRVEAPDGTPLAGAEVELEGWNRDRSRFTSQGAERGGPYVGTRRARSDALGRFWFGDLPGGAYALRARVAGRPGSAPLELELAAGEAREDVVVRLRAGGSLRGQVLDEHGNPLAGVYVSARGERLLDPVAPPPGHVHVRTGADGLFEIAGLPPGEYALHAYPLETPRAAPGEPWMPATVEHVSPGAQEIRIELARGSSIAGRVLDAGGAPLAGHVVATVASADGGGEYCETDADGRFELAVPRGSSWTLEVRGAPRGGEFDVVFAQRDGVAAGTRDLELRLER